MKLKWPNKGDERGCKGDDRSLVTIPHGLIGKDVILKDEVNENIVDTST